MQVTLTGFADEISPNLEEQITVMKSEGISHIELRGVYGKNVMKLTNAELDEVKSRLDANSFRISSIGSPIGKYGIRDDFSVELENVKRACEIAKIMDTPYIRIFSYFIPQGETHDEHRSEVLARMQQLISVAERHEITLLMENESAVYGDTDDRCLDILSTCNSPRLRLAFDPGNFVMNDVQPVKKALPKLLSYIDYVHIKDACTDKKIFVPAGAGDGELVPFIKHLKETQYSGFLSIEPHLHKYLPDLDGPSRFVHAVKALKDLLAAQDIDWH